MKPFVLAGRWSSHVLLFTLTASAEKSVWYTCRVPRFTLPTVIKFTRHIYSKRTCMYMIFVSQSIKLFKFVIKMSWWINTKKCWKTQHGLTAAEESAVWFISSRDLFFSFCTKLTKKWITSKNACLWSNVARPSALVFLSLLLSSSTFSHNKSVIIAQETWNTVTMLSLFLQKHDNYRKLSSIFFSSSCDTMRGKEGEEV